MKLCAALLLLLLVAVLLGLLLGGSRIGVNEVLQAFSHPHDPGPARDIVWGLRLPRIALAVFVGAGLAAAGCVLQGVLQNPLAEPFTLGVSGGAAVGVAAVLLAGFTTPWATGGGACLGALAVVLAVTALAASRGFSPATLLLAGVILNFICSAVVMFLFAVATSREVHSVVLWLMGDLSAATWPGVGLVALVTALGAAWLAFKARALDLLSLGEERAAHLGLDARRERFRLYVVASLVTGCGVAMAGVIGFVGLMVPHLLRRAAGPAHARLLPASLLGGAAFLVIGDALARTVVAPIELPVGVVTGFIGGVFALTLVGRARAWKVF